MADTPIPTYRCLYCLQALPEEHDQHLFGSSYLRPKSDDAATFVAETQNILRYASAVAVLCYGGEKTSDEVLHQAHYLLEELSEEALRRLDRAQEALEIVWDREEAKQQAHPMQPERGA